MLPFKHATVVKGLIAVTARLRSHLRSLLRLGSCQRGSIAMVALVSMTAIVLSAGVAIDFGTAYKKRSELQAIADSAAVAGARELALSQTDAALIESVSKKMVALKVSTTGLNLATAVDVNVDNLSVDITLTERWQPYFASLVTDDLTPIVTNARAQVAGAGKVCVVGLEETDARTVHLRRGAVLQANGCAVISNSVNSSSIQVDTNGELTANLICSAGGTSGSLSSFEPAPTTDCPALPDPLGDRPEPDVGVCDHTNFLADEHVDPSVNDGMVTVEPGVYCGGLRALTDTQVEFMPGVYYIKDGPLEAQGQASLKGQYVGFFLTGLDAVINFGQFTTISLSAPSQGDLAGLLFFESRSNPDSQVHRITSNDARELIGTFYLPVNRLFIDANAPVADRSAYTAIVARRLVLDQGPVLVLNSNYSSTDVPVAGGLSGVNGRIVLAR